MIKGKQKKISLPIVKRITISHDQISMSVMMWTATAPPCMTARMSALTRTAASPARAGTDSPSRIISAQVKQIRKYYLSALHYTGRNSCLLDSQYRIVCATSQRVCFILNFDLIPLTKSNCYIFLHKMWMSAH